MGHSNCGQGKVVIPKASASIFGRDCALRTNFSETVNSLCAIGWSLILQILSKILVTPAECNVCKGEAERVIQNVDIYRQQSARGPK